MAEILLGNIRGLKGDTGNGLTILDYYSTFEELTSAIPNPSAGDAYGVGDETSYDIYIYSPSKGWTNNGALQPDINEQAPNYDESTTLESLTSGEKISLAFGKIKKAIKELISHLNNKSNPHEVTKAQIDLGNVDNTSDADKPISTAQATAIADAKKSGTDAQDNLDSHIGDTTKHITSEERTKWDNKAPSGHGLGEHAPLRENQSFLETAKEGGGFYQIATNEDSPHTTNEWLNLIQVIRSKQEQAPTGAQLAFYDFSPNSPKMWFRTILSGVAGKWLEILHTGNLTTNKVARMETQSYTGNGLYGVDNARTFTFSFLPRIFFISGYGPGGGNYTLTVPQGFPFVSTVAAASGGGFTTLSCNFKYSGNSITMYNPSSATNGFNIEGSPYAITAIGY